MDWQQQIVLVSPFFYPELISTGKANQFLAEALVADGHRVTIVCSHPLYPSWKPTESHAEIRGMKILRGGKWVHYPNSMPMRRMLLEAWFAFYACRRIWGLRKKADIVISVLPPSLFSLLIGILLPQNVRRIAIVHDLQGVLAAQEKSILRRAIIRMIHAVESRAFQEEDLCVFFSGDMARVAQTSYGIPAQRIAVQYPFITLPQEQKSQYRRLSEEKYPGNRLEALLPANRLHVVYSGALGYKQNSQELIQLLHAAGQRFSDVDFHVFSEGPLFNQLKEKFEQEEGTRVHFHPLVSTEDLPELYARSSIQVIPQAEGTEVAALPSKLPNLLEAGVHLLAICREDTEVGRLVQLAGTGTVVERWDEQLFLDRLQMALQIVKSEPASVRRERVAPLRRLFSVSSLVALVIGKKSGQSAASPQTEIDARTEAAAAHGGMRS